MCGICGYINDKSLPMGVLKNMNDTMIHRGPNDSGEWERNENEFCVGLAHRRLSILDLSALGHQPMISNSGKTIVVFNGEIYNYLELKEQLYEYEFRSNCDTEVILAAYEKWGIDFLKSLNGMFSIALYDIEAKKLILARDRIGKKSLYYYWKEGKLAFGSELKPILNFPYFEKEINMDSITKFMCYQYISAPNTIYKDTYKLQAGHYAIFEKDELNVYQYWDIDKVERESLKSDDYSLCKEDLEKYLKKAVERRLNSDVPLGIFLSGGIDSVIIAALATQLSNKKIKTFTIGFHDEFKNEANVAKEIAEHLNTDHKELYIDDTSMLEMIETMCDYYDEPFADASLVPTMLVSKLAKEDVTVVLSGDGGDELFCGYGKYDYVQLAQRYDRIAGLCNSILSMPLLKIIKKKMPSKVQALLNNRNKKYKVQLFTDLIENEVKDILKIPFNTMKYEKESNLLDKNWQAKRMKLDMYTYLPDDILVKMDRASMKYSLEARCPILDKDVIECSFKIPHQFKYHKGEKKYILKDILYDYVPKELLDRPKQGFGVPLTKWLQHDLRCQLNRFLDKEKIINQNIFDYNGISNLVKKVDLCENNSKSDKLPYATVLWSYFVFQTWYDKYIKPWD